jgi:ribosomal protein S18 acetylase RimI-like enzyme
MSELVFRRLLPEEFEPAYDVVCQATDWLLAKGIRMWLRPIPVEVYRKRHEAGQNYGLLAGGEVAVVVSLLPYRPACWQEYLPDSGYVWLAALASGARFKGRDLGRVALREAAALLARQGAGAIYLDCHHGEGFLPRYYESVGYERVARKDLVLPRGLSDNVLMRQTLPTGPTAQHPI